MYGCVLCVQYPQKPEEGTRFLEPELQLLMVTWVLGIEQRVS